MIIAQYGFWLAVVSVGCFVAERIRPWRKQQSWRRPELIQDLAWLILNGYLLYLALGWLFTAINGWLDLGFLKLSGQTVNDVRIVASWPLAAQAALALVLADFIEWCVHNLLHRSAWLWRIHRVHHSITAMDWIGNFRFHFGEVIIYQTIKHLPLALLGASWQAMLIAAVISTTIGHLNHANLDISWGPLRYLLNSPRMHIWHHDKHPQRPAGINFAIVFSLWDWIFGTAELPPQPPAELGFEGQARTPSNFFWRLLLPFADAKQR